MKFILLLITSTILLFSKPLDKVTLHLKWKHQFQFAGFYMAKEKGFYRDLGLDVNLKEAYFNQNNTNLILDDENSFGISDSVLIYEKMQGKKIKVLGAIFQQTPLVLVYLKESGIKTPKDFENKTIMLDLNLKDNVLIKALVEKYDIDESSITFLPTSYDLNDLIEKKVDIYTAYSSNELFTLDEKKIEYDVIHPSDYGLNFYGDTIFTSEKNFNKNPKRVEKFYNASLKGWKYAFENIDETINVIKEKYNTQGLSSEKLYFEAKELEKLSEFKKGNLGKIELLKINHILSSYYLLESGFNLDYINNMDPYAIVNDKKLDFSVSELKYLKDKKELSYCNRNNFLPYANLKNGKYEGIVIDYIEEVEKKLDIKLKQVITKNWKECYSLLKNDKVDFTSLILTKPNNYEYLEPTLAYVKGYLVLATKINEPFLLNIENLDNKKIAVSKHAKNIIKFLKNKYPNINLKEVDAWKEGLKLVKQGKVYGFIGPSDSVAYRIQEYYPFELKIMNRLDDTIHSGSMGVKKGNSNLLSVLNKTISSIDEKKIREIRNTWVAVKHENDMNYSLLWKMILVFFILFLGFVYRQYLLNRTNIRLEKVVKDEVEKNREKDKVLFQQSKLASMGEMLNNIAHQWRQPLSAINSSVAVIDSKLNKKKIYDNDLEKNLADIESQTRYMSDTIESFRTFFNPLKDSEDFLISSAIDDVLRIVKYDYEKKGIKIKVFKQNDITINGFLGEYIQTIISILNNSKDAFLINDIKNPEINIYIDDMTIIDDNAGGISNDIIDRVFEPYFTTKHKNKGTGTGLYMAKMIIEHSMDGRLTIENIKNGCRLKIIV